MQVAETGLRTVMPLHNRLTENPQRIESGAVGRLQPGEPAAGARGARGERAAARPRLEHAVEDERRPARAGGQGRGGARPAGRRDGGGRQERRDRTQGGRL